MEAAGFYELLRLAQGGDRAAMERLLEVLRPQLERAARTHLGEAGALASASDLVQESWMRAWERLQQFTGGEDERETQAMFRAWISRIVRNVCLQSRRNLNRHKRRAPGGLRRIHAGFREPTGPRPAAGSSIAADPAASDSTPSAGMRREEEAREVRAALARLESAEEREVLRLRFFEGQTLQQISSRLSLTYDQVRERFHQGMGRLQRELRRLD